MGIDGKNKDIEKYIDSMLDLIENKYEVEWRKNTQNYSEGKIDIIKLFESYHKIEIYNKKEENKRVYLEKEIYNFIEKNIFYYYEKRNVVISKNIRKDKKYFLKYIKDQVILKSAQNKIGIENSLHFKDNRKSNYKQILLENLEEYQRDSGYYTRKYREFIKNEKNKHFKLLTICPDIIYFLVMHNYPTNTEEKTFINKQFLNIIKDQMTLKHSEYLFDDLVRFYDKIDEIVELNEYDNLIDAGYSIFEQIFKGYRTKLIFSKINEKSRKLDKKAILTLSLVLQMKDIELSEKYIHRILNKNSNLERTFTQVLVYNLVYAIIDDIIDIIVKNHSINCGKYYEVSDVYRKMRELNNIVTDKDEEIFYDLKWSESFFKVIELGKNTSRLTKIRLFEEMKTINSINLAKIEKMYNEFYEKNNIKVKGEE